MKNALRIHVQGIVQGVGFRPFVYRLAKRYLIHGWVLNSKEGVDIHAEGDERLVDEFVMEIAQNHPEAARVTEIDLKEVPLEDFEDFQIRFSDEQETERVTHIAPGRAVYGIVAGPETELDRKRWLQGLLDFIADRGLTIAGDGFSRLIFVMQDGQGARRRYDEVWIPVE